MTSKLHPDFIKAFRKLPKGVQKTAKRNYKLWTQNASHPSLQFKQVHKTEPIFSVRVGIGWRALGLVDDDSITWFWIGSHANYDKLIAKL